MRSSFFGMGVQAFLLLSLCFALKTRSLELLPTPTQPTPFETSLKRLFKVALNRAEMTQLLGDEIAKNPFKTELTTADNQTFQVHYTINQQLQSAMEDAYKKAKVKYGAFVAIDPATGKVLSMVSHGMPDQNMALRSTFPAASVFKVITASAVIENGKLSYNSLIPFAGSYHTLYKRNLFKAGGITPDQAPRFTRFISFSDALAKSVNSVFGKIGIFGLGAAGVRQAADRFAFNQPIPFELPVEASKSEVPEDSYGLAESASGFTKSNTMSPLHGALIAASVIQDGAMMEPTIVDKVFDSDGKTVYEQIPALMMQASDAKTAKQLQLMLRKTVTMGTSRGSFRGVNRIPALSDTFIGGKTGTLDGWDPPGRYDWFVGFADNGVSKIAVAALCIHGELRGVKASRIARTAFETYFKKVIAKNDL